MEVDKQRRVDTRQRWQVFLRKDFRDRATRARVAMGMEHSEFMHYALLLACKRAEETGELLREAENLDRTEN